MVFYHGAVGTGTGGEDETVPTTVDENAEPRRLVARGMTVMSARSWSPRGENGVRNQFIMGGKWCQEWEMLGNGV